MARQNPEGFYVYAYYEPGRDGPLYIGKGHGNRAWKHLCPCHLKRRAPFACKLRSLGRNGVVPDIVILVSGLTEAVAFACERALIFLFGRRNTGAGSLFNLTDGGEGSSGAVVSAQTRHKLRVASTGKQQTRETRQAIAEALKGRPVTWGDKIGRANSRSATIRATLANNSRSQRKQLLAQNDVVRLSFTGRNEALRQGYSRSGIQKALKTGRPYRGFFWKYKEATDETSAPRGESTYRQSLGVDD